MPRSQISTAPHYIQRAINRARARDDSRIWIRSKAKEDATRSSNVLFRIKLLTRKTEI